MVRISWSWWPKQSRSGPAVAWGRPWWGRLAAALPAVLITAGCGAEDQTTTDDTAVADTTGVPVVQLQHPDSAPVLRVGAPVTLRSTEDDRSVLYQVSGATRLRDGRTVVANFGTAELFVYDTAARLLQVTGGEGDGPGEFQQLWDVWWVGGDTIATFDRRHTRVSLFAGTPLTLVDDFRLEQPQSASRATTSIVGSLRDGSVLARSQTYPEGYVEQEGVSAIDHLVFRSSTDGAVAPVLRTSPGRQLWLGPLAPGQSVLGVYGDAPFSARTYYGQAGDQFLVFTSDDFGFTAFDPDGRAVRRFHRDHEPRLVTPAAEERHREEWVRAFGDDEETWARRRALLADIPYPDHMPAYRTAYTDRVGNAWLEPFSWWDSDALHLVGYDGEGRGIGRLELPYGARILEIGDGWVLTREEEAYGQEVVRVREMERE